MLIKNLPSLLVICTILLLCAFVIPQDNLPLTNKKIIEFCDMKLKKKVGNGECWDLANYALQYANAKWSPPYEFGKKVNYKTEQILSGDIIQFEKVKIELGNGSTEKMPHHTAIVYQVLGKNKYLIAHQNLSGVKKVNKTELDLNFLTKGSVAFFRPQP